MTETAFERGNRLSAANQQEQAIAAFSECLQHNPQDWQALFNRGTAQMRLKQYPQALEDYLAAAALNPASSNISSSLTAVNGVNSAGLKIMALPQASAGAAFQQAICNG